MSAAGFCRRGSSHLPQIAEESGFGGLHIRPADGDAFPGAQNKILSLHGGDPPEVDRVADMAPAQLRTGGLGQQNIQLIPGLQRLTRL